MTERKFKKLIDRYLSGTATEDERKLVSRFYAISSTDEVPEPLSDEKKAALEHDIYATIQKGKKPGQRQPVRRKSGVLLWRVAATVALATGISLFYYSFRSQPGVSLIVRKTEIGQKARYVLSDSTVVVLNAGSSVTFPETFAENIREISLTGEAYFEVKRDPDRPFVVRTSRIQTTVLGTSFVINAADPAATTVALVTGKVRVSNLPDAVVKPTEVVLAPGEMATYEVKSDSLVVGRYSPAETLLWKDGVIYFRDASHQQVFTQLSRWYGVTFAFQNKPKHNWKYSGEFKDMSLELVLNTIQFTENFDFTIDNKTATIHFTE